MQKYLFKHFVTSIYILVIVNIFLNIVFMEHIFQYNNQNITFQLGNGDVMVNATQMAKPFNRRPNDYLNLPTTKQLIEAITRKYGSDDYQAFKTINGGSNPGTWLHEDIALDFAQWLSIDFKLWCNDRIKELLQKGFTATPDKLEELVNNPDLLITLATELKNERAEKERLKFQNELQRNELKASAPKVEYFNTVLESKSDITTTIIAKELGLSAQVLNKKLKELGIQYKQGETWVLYQKHQNKGYTETNTFPYLDSNGNTQTRISTVWTEKGRLFIHQLLKKQPNERN